MTPTITARHALTVIGLTVAWCALWRDISFANVAAGLGLGIVITVLGVGTNTSGSVRIVPLLKLGGVIFLDLVKSTINVAIEVLTPTDYTDESIVAVELPAHAKDHMLLLVLAITLTPGTAVIEADPDEATIYLHLLHDDRRAETIAHAKQLAKLAHAALPITHAGATR